MNTTIKTRLAKLEAHYSEPDNRPVAVFIKVVDGRKGSQEESPILGWSFKDGTHKVMRVSGETDQALQQRAIEKARTMISPEATPVFFPITEEDQPCAYVTV